MTDTKVLQAILDGQVAIREDTKAIREELKKVESNLVQRIDKLGLQLADLADDSPTNEEFDSLKSRVKTLERHFLPA